MSKAHRARPKPRLLPKWTMPLVLLAGIASIFLSDFAAQACGGFAVVVGIAYFVQHWRLAGWIMDQETDRRIVMERD